MLNNNDVKYNDDIKYTTIMFFYLFYFKIYNLNMLSYFDSTLIIGIFFSILLFVSTKYRKIFVENIKKLKINRLILSCLALLVFALFIIFANQSFEFSICRPIIHQLLFIIIGIEFFYYLKYKGYNDYILKFIIQAYALQTFIQYGAFIFEPLNLFTNLFKSENIIILKEQYDGFRLNAISGGLAFSLAGAYAYVVSIFLFRWNEINIKWKKCIFLLLIAGSLPAGRISLLFIILAFFYKIAVNIIQNKSRKIEVKTIKNIIYIFFGIILLALLGPKLLEMYNPVFVEKLNTISYWMVKWIPDYFEGRDSSSGYDFWSTNYSVLSDINNYFIGDGLFENQDGTYYLRQDAGYVRILGFGGLLWLAALLIHQLMFFCMLDKRKYENAFFFIMILIATLKSCCLGMDLQILLLMVLVYLFNLEEYYTKRRLLNIND